MILSASPCHLNIGVLSLPELATKFDSVKGVKPKKQITPPRGSFTSYRMKVARVIKQPWDFPPIKTLEASPPTFDFSSSTNLRIVLEVSISEDYFHIVYFAFIYASVYGFPKATLGKTSNQEVIGLPYANFLFGA